MRLLLDMGLAARTADFLNSLGHDAVHIGRLGLSRHSDDQILQLAASESRIAVTFDLDFPRIIALQRLAQPSVILFRLEKFTTDELHSLLASLLVNYDADLTAGSIIVVDSHRIRVRRLPLW